MLVHQNVRRLQIAMNDAALVRIVDGVADLGHQLQPLLRARVVRRGVVRQGLPAGDELHGEVRLHSGSGIGGARFIHLRNARMVQPCQRVGLLRETPQQARAGPGAFDHFERNDAAGLILFSLVDRAHAAFAEQAKDAVVADASRDRRIAIRRRTGNNRSRLAQRSCLTLRIARDARFPRINYTGGYSIASQVYLEAVT